LVLDKDRPSHRSAGGTSTLLTNAPLSARYETFDGNRSDGSTLETILRRVERKYGKARRIWVFDRGI
jgi:hypothetical protein